jgi:hypothetical protein
VILVHDRDKAPILRIPRQIRLVDHFARRGLIGGRIKRLIQHFPEEGLVGWGERSDRVSHPMQKQCELNHDTNVETTSHATVKRSTRNP